MMYFWILVITLFLSYLLSCYLTHIEMNYHYAKKYKIRCIAWGDFHQFKELWDRTQYKDYLEWEKIFPYSLFIHNSKIPEKTDINESSELYLHAGIIGFKHFTIWLNPIAYIRYLIWLIRKIKIIKKFTNRL